MKICKQCGYILSFFDEEPDNDRKGVDVCRLAVPWWLWVVPVPLLLALMIRYSGPRFCCPECQRAYREAHPYAWAWQLLKLTVGFVILYALVALAASF